MKKEITTKNDKNMILNYMKLRIKLTFKEMRRKKISYLFIAPFCLLFTLFYLIPVISSMVLSFTYFNILEEPDWIGWQNYINLFFVDDVFLTAVKNTFLYAIITGPLGYIAALLFAWLINELPPKVRAVMTLIFYAPTISGQAFIVWGIFFSSDIYGFINGWLMKLGIIYLSYSCFMDESWDWVFILYCWIAKCR